MANPGRDYKVEQYREGSTTRRAGTPGFLKDENGVSQNRFKSFLKCIVTVSASEGVARGEILQIRQRGW